MRLIFHSLTYEVRQNVGYIDQCHPSRKKQIRFTRITVSPALSREVHHTCVQLVQCLHYQFEEKNTIVEYDIKDISPRY